MLRRPSADGAIMRTEESSAEVAEKGPKKANDSQIVAELTNRLKEATRNLQLVKEKARRREKDDSQKLDLVASRVRHLESEKLFLAAQVDEYKSAVEAVVAQRDEVQESLRLQILDLEDQLRRQQKTCDSVVVLRAQLQDNNNLAARVQEEMLRAKNDADHAHQAQVLCKKQSKWLQKRIHHILEVKDKLLLELDTEKGSVQEMKKRLASKENDVAQMQRKTAEAAVQSEQLLKDLDDTKTKLKAIHSQAESLANTNHQLRADLAHSKDNLIQQIQARVDAEEESSIATFTLRNVRERILDFLDTHGMKHDEAGTSVTDQDIEELLAVALKMTDQSQSKPSTPASRAREKQHPNAAGQTSSHFGKPEHHLQPRDHSRETALTREQASVDELEVLDSPRAQPPSPLVNSLNTHAAKPGNSPVIMNDEDEASEKCHLWGRRTTDPHPLPIFATGQNSCPSNAVGDNSKGECHAQPETDEMATSQQQSQDAIASIFAACRESGPRAEDDISD